MENNALPPTKLTASFQGSKNLLPDSELWLLMRTTWFAISRLQAIDLARYKITPEQASILTIIQREGTATLRELEDITMRQHNSLTILINRMIKAGHVRRGHRSVGKGFVISLTPQGKTLINNLQSDTIDVVFTILTPRQKTNLLMALEPLFRKSHDLLVATSQPPFVQILKNMEAANNTNVKAGGKLSSMELWNLFDRTVFAGSRLRELELAPLGLTLMQTLVLKIIHDNGGATSTGVLEDITLRQHHSISTLVNRMERLGLVTHQRSPHSRRYIISATPKGKSLYAGMTTYAIDMTLGSLKPAQKMHLAECLDKLMHQARQMLGAG